MKTSRPVLTGFLLLLVGLAAGIYLQHRWPLGRLLAELRRRPSPAERSSADLARIPVGRRLVIVAAGQSNAANYGETRRAAGERVYAFADGALHAAVDPLPGGDGDGGSVWTRLGAKLAMTGNYDAIVIAVVAEGSTALADWTPGGRCHPRLVETLRQLAAAGLPADYFLWQQGESEARQPTSSGRDYAAGLAELHRASRAIFPQVHFVVAQATHEASAAINEQIRLAQATAAALPGALAGPDLDRLGENFRRDGLHFTDRGLSAAADLWLEALGASLAEHDHTTPAP